MRLELFPEPVNLSLYWSGEAKRPAQNPFTPAVIMCFYVNTVFVTGLQSGSISPYTFTLSSNVRLQRPHCKLIPFLHAPPAAGNMLSSFFPYPPSFTYAYQQVKGVFFFPFTTPYFLCPPFT